MSLIRWEREHICCQETQWSTNFLKLRMESTSLPCIAKKSKRTRCTSSILSREESLITGPFPAILRSSTSTLRSQNSNLSTTANCTNSILADLVKQTIWEGQFCQNSLSTSRSFSSSPDYHRWPLSTCFHLKLSQSVAIRDPSILQKFTCSQATKCCTICTI